MRKPKLRELGEAIKVAVMGPYTIRFPAEPSTPPDIFRGKPAFDPDICIGCGACSEVCPSNAIEVADDPGTGTRILKLHYDICNFCGQCHLSCTTENGINFTQEYDLAGWDRADMVVSVEKDLALCECCGEVVGTRDHLKWLARRLGTLAWGNPSLILALMEDLGQSEPMPKRESDRPLGRDDLFRIICPKCRRTIWIAEEWGQT